jgi:hypothetical protein
MLLLALRRGSGILVSAEHIPGTATTCVAVQKVGSDPTAHGLKGFPPAVGAALTGFLGLFKALEDVGPGSDPEAALEAAPEAAPDPRPGPRSFVENWNELWKLDQARRRFSDHLGIVAAKLCWDQEE